MAYRGDDLATFMRDIAHLATDEARKAKLLFLRNGIAQLAADFENAKTFGWLQLAFALVPFFWPILYVQRRTMITDADAGEKKLRNALEVWKADLGSEAAALDAELTQLAAKKPTLLPWSGRPQRALPP